MSCLEGVTNQQPDSLSSSQENHADPGLCSAKIIHDCCPAQWKAQYISNHDEKEKAYTSIQKSLKTGIFKLLNYFRKSDFNWKSEMQS